MKFIFANLQKSNWSFRLESRLETSKFQKSRDDKQELTFRRGLPYSWLGFRRPQGDKWSPTSF